MWSSESRIPIQSAPQNGGRPIKRLHTARYYAHRVKESLSTRIMKLICSIFLTLLFLVGIITFILWLSLRPHRPRFHVEGFSIPALAQGGGLEAAQVIYNATARNANQNIGIHYDSMQLTVFYEEQSIGGVPVFSSSFDQQPKNTTIIAGQLGGATLTLTSERWQRMLAARARGEVIFRLEISSVIRFKISTWESKSHRMHANCPVGVGPAGSILPIYRDKRCPVYFG